MKKSLRFGAAAIAAVATLSLASCGFGGSAGDGGGDDANTIDLLVPSYSDGTKANWETVIEGFEKANPDLKVNLEVQSWDNLEKVVSTKIQGNEAPDVYLGGPFAGFAADDLLYDVEEVVSPETFGDFQESFIKNEQLDGTTYALPFIASARALFVNNALLTQAGVQAPTTWDELLDAATKISALGGGVAGYGMPLGSEEAQAEAAVWLWGGGGSFGDESEITIDTPENLAGAEQIKKMIDAGATQADPGSTDRSPLMDIFVQGKIGMQVGLPPTVGQIAEGNPDLDYSIVPIPTKDGSPFTLGVADQLMAFENDGDKAEAITAFFDYFYAPDVYVPWVEAEGFLPVTKSGSEQLAGDEALKPFLDVLPDAQFYPSTNAKWSATDGAFKSLFGQLQSKPAQDVLAEIQAQVDAG
jgi:multiple sugar transport system substrate-binding protein